MPSALTPAFTTHTSSRFGPALWSLCVMLHLLPGCKHTCRAICKVSFSRTEAIQNSFILKISLQCAEGPIPQSHSQSCALSVLPTDTFKLCNYQYQVMPPRNISVSSFIVCKLLWRTAKLKRDLLKHPLKGLLIRDELVVLISHRHKPPCSIQGSAESCPGFVKIMGEIQATSQTVACAFKVMKEWLFYFPTVFWLYKIFTQILL